MLPGESAAHTQAGQVAEPLYASLAFLGEKKKEEEEAWAPR